MTAKAMVIDSSEDWRPVSSWAQADVIEPVWSAVRRIGVTVVMINAPTSNRNARSAAAT